MKSNSFKKLETNQKGLAFDRNKKIDNRILPNQHPTLNTRGNEATSNRREIRRIENEPGRREESNGTSHDDATTITTNTTRNEKEKNKRKERKKSKRRKDGS